jgi:hypothetical protein
MERNIGQERQVKTLQAKAPRQEKSRQDKSPRHGKVTRECKVPMQSKSKARHLVKAMQGMISSLRKARILGKRKKG